MPRKSGPRMSQFSVSLPEQAIAMMKELEEKGLHGPSRAEVARKLILDQLTDLQGRGIVKPVRIRAKRKRVRK